MVNYNALGQIIDSTWGRSSTPKTSSYSVKFSTNGFVLNSMFSTIINFSSEKDSFEMKKLSLEEGKKITAEAIKKIKADYKELTGETLNLKEVSSSDSIEIIGLGVYNPKRTAYFRLKTVFEMK